LSVFQTCFNEIEKFIDLESKVRVVFRVFDSLKIFSEEIIRSIQCVAFFNFFVIMFATFTDTGKKIENP
jgi:hypothetical protein